MTNWPNATEVQSRKIHKLEEQSWRFSINWSETTLRKGQWRKEAST